MASKPLTQAALEAIAANFPNEPMTTKTICLAIQTCHKQILQENFSSDSEQYYTDQSDNEEKPDIEEEDNLFIVEKIRQ